MAIKKVKPTSSGRRFQTYASFEGITRTEPEKSLGYQDDYERQPCFVSIVVWAQQAIQCNKYLRKGHPVMIIGELQSMPNASPTNGFFPVQINAQWIQYLEKNDLRFDLNREDDLPGEPEHFSEDQQD